MVAQNLSQRPVEDVGSGVVASDCCAALWVDGGRHGLSDIGARCVGSDLVAVQAVEGEGGISHVDGPAVPCDGSGVAHLATGLGVERGAVEDHDLSVGEHHHGLGTVLFATHELGWATCLQHGAQVTDGGCGAVLAGRAGHVLLAGHGHAECLVVDCHTLLGRDLLGQLKGEAVGVVQLEGHVSVKRGALVEAFECIVEDRKAGSQGLAKTAFFAFEDVAHEGVVAYQVGVVVAHDGDDGVDQRGHDEVLDSKQPGVAHCPTDDAAQHVAAVLVAGEHPIADEKG